MKVLKAESHGADVTRWQLFLIGQSFLKTSRTLLGHFDADTVQATKAFQQSVGLVADGVVGPKTVGIAMAVGFNSEVMEYDEDDTTGAEWPRRPDLDIIRPLSYAEREHVFGKIVYRLKPVRGNPEGIEITNDWPAKHLTVVTIPEMKLLAARQPKRGWPSNGKVTVHKIIAEPIVRLFGAWGEAKLLDHLLTYAGCWVPRCSRGSTALSNHAYGTAFDVNAPWNGLGCVPALKGKEGSVRELVQIAVQHRFYWGGWGWSPGYLKLDGMHLEFAPTA